MCDAVRQPHNEFIENKNILLQTSARVCIPSSEAYNIAYGNALK